MTTIPSDSRAPYSGGIQTGTPNPVEIKGQFPDMDFIFSEDHRAGDAGALTRSLVVETHIVFGDTQAQIDAFNDLKTLIGALRNAQSIGDAQAAGLAAYRAIKQATNVGMAAGRPALAIVQGALRIIGP